MLNRLSLTKLCLLTVLCLLLVALPVYAQESTAEPAAEAATEAIVESETDGQQLLIRLTILGFGLAAVLGVGGYALRRVRQGQGDLD